MSSKKHKTPFVVREEHEFSILYPEVHPSEMNPLDPSVETSLRSLHRLPTYLQHINFTLVTIITVKIHGSNY